MSMNFMTPYVYSATAGADLAIPATLMTTPLKKFNGSRTVIKSVPSSSGAVGASSTMLFNLPTGAGTGYIKSGSMYLRFKLVVSITGTTGVTWAFAGQGCVGGTNNTGVAIGGASSLIDRMIVSIGGVQCSVINNYNQWRNAVIPHVTSSTFFNDLAQMEYAGITKTATVDNDTNKTVYCCVPILSPCFNSESSIPTFLLNGGPISVEIATAPVNSAFYTVTNGISAYTISEASIVYESIEVSEDFKNAMRQKVATDGTYDIHLEDIYNISVGSSQSIDYNIGLSLSSLKAVCWTEQLTDNNSATIAKLKYFTCNALSDAKIYVDNQLVNNVAIDNDSISYIEMNRAVGRIYDSNLGSTMLLVGSTINTTNKRSSYPEGAFLGGVSTGTVSDWNFSSSGVPCNQLTVHLEHAGTSDLIKWGSLTAMTYTSSAIIYIFCMYDSVLSIDANGSVIIRK